jgi:deoxyribodipyrimidine photo-lyase
LSWPVDPETVIARVIKEESQKKESAVSSPLATRAAGEEILRHFTPRMGADYATRRNTDLGAGHHTHVSCLSPFIRRRLVLEESVVQAALDQHGPERAEKFIQEVFWRSYFKGWLEHRPSVWTAYRQDLARDLEVLDQNPNLRSRVAAAEEGRTGLTCFNHWSQELVESGYLHNHARMWFASIWIFTLGLPWRIGADFFYRHLLDGDPASNTLSWRWVAGLHTRGKSYAAQAANIKKFTEGRFSPNDQDLAANVQSLEHTEPEDLHPLISLRKPLTPDPQRPALLLMTEEDCRLEDFSLSAFDIRAVVTLSASHLRSARPVSARVIDFEQRALSDTAIRNQLEPVTLTPESLPELLTLARAVKVGQIITPYITQGPLGDLFRAVAPEMARQGISLCEWRRDWDAAIWPHATAGFFRVKQKIPMLLRQVRR